MSDYVLDESEAILVKDKKGFAVEDISFTGTGGSDMVGEWQWNGNYEMSLSRSYQPVLYNFYATINRRHSRTSTKTNGWSISLYLNMFYSNGRDIKLLEKNVNSLKLAKQMIFEKVQEVHMDVSGTKQLVETWKNRKATPVFILQHEKPILVGTSYISASCEMDKDKQALWFNDDIPDYKNHRIFYELCPAVNRKPIEFYVDKTEKMWGGYSGSSEKNESLVQEMIKVVRDNPKYSWMFEGESGN